MATRILIEDVDTFVENVLLQIRAGCQAVNQVGLQVELPEFADFALEVVSAAQSLETVTVTVNEQTEGAGTSTTTETTTGNEVTVESAVEDTETTARVATVDTTESGGDEETVNNTFEEFIDS